MKKKTNKSCKLRDFVCVICNQPFQNRISPSQIKKGRGKVCSKDCGRKWSSVISRRGWYQNCIKCNKEFYTRPSESKHHKNKNGLFYKRKYCSIGCFKNIGGKFISADGYYILKTPYGQMKEHRWILTQHLGRKLLSSEIVHHINWNKLDNRLENLQILTRSQHNKIHCTKVGKNQR